MWKSEAILGVALLLSAAPCFSESRGTSSVTFLVVTSFGELLPGGEVRVDGQLVHKVITFKGRTTVTLPYGTYRLTSGPSASYWAFEKLIDVIVPKTFVFVCFAPKEAWAIWGEGTPNPYTVKGMVTVSHPKANKLFARLKGLYLPSSAETEIDEKGHFELAARFQGSYSVEVIDGESIVSTKTIRLDESTERPVRVDFTVR